MERSNIGSHLRRVLTGLALASAMALATAVEAKLHSITIGQNGQLNWRGEGTAPVDVCRTIQLYIAGDSTRFAALDIDDNQLVRLTGKHSRV